MQVTPLYGGWLTDAGSYLGKATRGILETAGQALNIARGTTDSSDVLVSSAPAKPDYTGPILLGAAALLGVVVLTAKRKRGH